MASGVVEHEGVVSRAERGVVCVKITSQSACGACKAREACGLAEAQEKIVEVRTSDAESYAPGDAVTVGVRKRAGGIAVLLAYVGGLAVLLAVLTVLIAGFEWSEGGAALTSLAAVGCYYVVLWAFRKKIEKTIHFTITKNY